MEKRTLTEDFKYVFSLPTWPNQDFQLEMRLVEAMKEPKRSRRVTAEIPKLGDEPAFQKGRLVQKMEKHYFRCGIMDCPTCVVYLKNTGAIFKDEFPF